MGYNTDQFNILLVGNSKGEKIEQKKYLERITV